ncbi:MAG: hypothetical protein HFJ34_02035 [Clostridia bacterium]|nr:hypothetical protein [Clostridia bacterium]
MKANFYIESQQFCYAFENYKIEEINGIRYVIPEKNAKQRVSTSSERMNEFTINLLNIGKKAYYNEKIEDIEILDYVRNFGLFGFMADFPINRYFILDDNVALRDYNFIIYKDYVSVIKIEDYLKMFMPKLNDTQITNLIKKCIDNIKPTIMEKYLTPELNEWLIFSKDYAEPVDMIIQYAKLIYDHLVDVLENRHLLRNIPILNINNLSNSIDSLQNGQIILKYNYLKQAIDLNFMIQLSQDTIMLKICKFCHKAFIAANSKAEYDTPQCKNKANVYSFRKRAQEE